MVTGVCRAHATRGGSGTVRARPAMGGGFNVLQGSAARAAAVANTSALLGVDGLFALQEQEDARERDARGRQRLRAMLDGLRRLQAGLLTGAPDRDALRAMAALTVGPAPADPALGALLQAASVRARVELARLEL
jgi:hypothetical protein